MELKKDSDSKVPMCFFGRQLSDGGFLSCKATYLRKAFFRRKITSEIMVIWIFNRGTTWDDPSIPLLYQPISWDETILRTPSNSTSFVSNTTCSMFCDVYLCQVFFLGGHWCGWGPPAMFCDDNSVFRSKLEWGKWCCHCPGWWMMMPNDWSLTVMVGQLEDFLVNLYTVLILMDSNIKLKHQILVTFEIHSAFFDQGPVVISALVLICFGGRRAFFWCPNKKHLPPQWPSL